MRIKLTRAQRNVVEAMMTGSQLECFNGQYTLGTAQHDTRRVQERTVSALSDLGLIEEFEIGVMAMGYTTTPRAWSLNRGYITSTTTGHTCKSRLSPLLRDANWVLGFGPGTIWSDGEASGFRPNRLGELKEMGVLLPHPEEKGLLMVSALPLFPPHCNYVNEIRLSDCPSGCKIYQCQCGNESLLHNPIYGGQHS